MEKVFMKKGINNVKLDMRPDIRLVESYRKAYSVHRGSLLFSMPLGLNFTLLEHHYGYNKFKKGLKCYFYCTKT